MYARVFPLIFERKTSIFYAVRIVNILRTWDKICVKKNRFVVFR